MRNRVAVKLPIIVPHGARFSRAAAIDAALVGENKLFSAMLQQRAAKEAFTALCETRKPDFSRFS